MTAVVAALAAAGLLLLIALVLLARRAAALAADLRLVAARLGVNHPEVRVDLAAIAAALDRREAATDAERRDRARLREALDAAGIGVLITDSSGGVVLANRAALPYLSGRPGEAAVEGRVSEAIGAALDHGESFSRELELYTPRRRVVRLEVTPLDDAGGRRLGAVAYLADVTEERRVEAMRRDFVANVGHELKTPLGAMSVLAETLSANAGDATVAERLAGRLQAEASRLARLLDDMLDLSQAEAAADPGLPVSLAGLVAEVAGALGETAAQAGVELIVEGVPAEAVVAGDERQLRTMLGNLLDNAVKYSDPRPGRPAPRVWLRVRAEGERVVLEVQDEGIGIPEAHLGRIFERFYRVDRARSRATGGTGLGLSIVRHVVLNHGGQVGVESHLGEGSLFRVCLPKWREP
ncbi:MAG: PAS domain-containing protein [Acidimicrobiia bacterium]|nr:PAS domain-containing protein [Acidimicrobiia bacterium]